MQFRREAPETEVAAVAQANRPHDWAVEMKPKSKADIDRRLRTTLPTAHKVPERKRLTSPIEHVDPGGRKFPALQFCFDLTDE